MPKEPRHDTAVVRPFGPRGVLQGDALPAGGGMLPALHARFDMLCEIVVPGIGVVRHLEDWQLAAVKRCSRANRHRLILAMSCRMSLKQFNRLPPEQQEMVRLAQLTLTSPGNI